MHGDRLAASIQNITLHGEHAWRPCESTFNSVSLYLLHSPSPALSSIACFVLIIDFPVHFQLPTYHCQVPLREGGGRGGWRERREGWREREEGGGREGEEEGGRERRREGEREGGGEGGGEEGGREGEEGGRREGEREEGGREEGSICSSVATIQSQIENWKFF